MEKIVMTHAERQKAYKLRNRDRWNEVRRRHYANHRGSRREKDKIYRTNNHERLLVRRKQYYINHREVLTFQQRQRNKTIRYKIHIWRKRDCWKYEIIVFLLFHIFYLPEMTYAKFAYNLKGGKIKQLPTIERKRLRQVNIRFTRNINFLDEIYI